MTTATLQYRTSTNPWPVLSLSVVGPDGQSLALSANLRPGRMERSSSATGGLRSDQGFAHTPVMAEEVAQLFASVPAGLIVDATIGGGGHAAALLEARPELSLLGVDRDALAVRAARSHLARFGERVEVHQARFDALSSVLAASHLGTVPVVGVLFDLGVSSPQLDDPARGFSYREDGPLDMRMDPSVGPSAGDLLNSATEDDLSELFAANGEDRFARRIARAVIAARPVTSTAVLAEAVTAAIPAAARRRGHPARRIFQALRIAVNDELEILAPALDAAVELLVPGGRIVVLSYHSGEDRIVKQRLAFAATGGCTCPPQLPCVCGAVPSVRLLTRGARMPSPAEESANPRAESARLRAAERLEIAVSPRDEDT